MALSKPWSEILHHRNHNARPCTAGSHLSPHASSESRNSNPDPENVAAQIDPHFRFFDLPAELRNTVYVNSIKSGTIAILQASKRVNNEATRFLYGHRVYQVRVSLEQRGKASKRTEKNHNAIWANPLHQHWDLYAYCNPRNEDNVVVMDFPGCYEQYLQLPISVRPSRAKTCFITIAHHGIDDFVVPNELIPLMRHLDIFEEVRFMLHTGVDFHPRDRRIMRGANGARVTRFNNSIYPTHKEVLTDLATDLADILGPSTFHDSPDLRSRYIEFHPLTERPATNAANSDG